MCLFGTLCDILNTAFENRLKSRRELSMDEQMINIKAWVSFTQYMLKKPKKFGIKLWPLCETSSGYCLKFQIHKGKENDAVEKG